MYDGELIKKLRVNKKLTQSQLAEGICFKTSLVGIETNSVKNVICNIEIIFRANEHDTCRI